MKLSSLLPALGLAVCATACSQEAALPASSFACPLQHAATKQVEQKTIDTMFDALQGAFAAAIGPEAGKIGLSKVRAKLEMTRVDDGKMAALANVSACAALIDVNSGCALYYDPELGDPLSAFMGMKKTAPLRKQFEEAIARVPNLEQRRAAQTCIKLVGGKR
jgi:hypothetical protein